MRQLRVIIVGTSPAETLRLEEALQQAGVLESFRYIGLEQALDRAPDWDNWDLLMALYQERSGNRLLSLLAPVLRISHPPIVFLIDPFDPVVVTRLLNAGGQRVIPLDGFERVIEPTLSAIFDPHRQIAPRMVPATAAGRIELAEPPEESVAPAPLAEGMASLFWRGPIGVCMIRLRDGKYIDCNESFAHLLEWPREDLIEREALDLAVPAGIRQQLEEAGRAADWQPQAAVIQLERRIYTRRRQIRQVELHLALAEWAGQECLLVLVQDITEVDQVKEKLRRLNDTLERMVQVRTGALEAANRELEAEIRHRQVVEQELRQSRERYRTLAEAAHDLIFMVSKDGVMEYANTYACHALGFELGKIEGMPAGQFFPRDFVTHYLQLFAEVCEIDRPVYTEVHFMQSEMISWLGTWLVPIHNEQGGLVSILGISRDITEQKKVDETLQKALQNERRLGEMRSSFFSMTSHQFRTPLSTILLSAELMYKYGQRWDDQKRTEHLIRIQESAKRLNSLLDDILVIGRVESGRYQCAPKDFDLIAFLQQAIGEVSATDQGEHQVAFDHEREEMPVFLDPAVLHRVVDNLLSNAIKYSPCGTRVTVQVKVDAPDFVIEVTDQGIGIPERDIQYLFQPFQRGSNASEFPGSGIGLAIIQKSVEMMNGTVSLKSIEGQGTTFMVRFPARFDNV